jgi:hypothetical protein
MKDSSLKLSEHCGESAPDRGKVPATLLSLALIGAVLWPLQQNWREKPRDNFPLSYYPMFSAKRKAIESFNYLAGHDEHGTRHIIPYKFAGVGGLNSTRRQIGRIVREGRADELAATVARRLARQEKAPWSQIVTVAVVTGSYGVDDYFHGRKEPVSEKIRASCPVERRTQ